MPRADQKFDARAAWAWLSRAEQRGIGVPAVLLGFAEAAAYQVDGCRATAWAAARYHAAIALQRAFAATPALEETLGDLRRRPPRPDLSIFGVRHCRRCGCTDEIGCPEGCHWVAPDLCSLCAL